MVPWDADPRAGSQTSLGSVVGPLDVDVEFWTTMRLLAKEAQRLSLLNINSLYKIYTSLIIISLLHFIH